MKKILSISACILVLAGTAFAVSQFFFASKASDSSRLHTQPLGQAAPPPKPTTQKQKIVYGYLPYWTKNTARLPKELTHVSYFSLTIQKDGTILSIPKSTQDPGFSSYKNGVLETLSSKLNENQQLELTLSMMIQEDISVFIQDVKAHQNLVSQIQQLLQTNSIDGINIDIEYNGIVSKELQSNFSSLITTIRSATREKNPEFLLTVAIYGDTGQIDRLTNVELLSPHVDYFIMMAYDYHRRVSPRSGPVSPLYGKSDEKWEADILNDLQALTKKIPSNQILLGIPFYGYDWAVEDPVNPQSFTIPKTGTTATYQQVQTILSRPEAKLYWDKTAFSPYVRYERDGQQRILYFENPQSLRAKLDLVEMANLAGIAIWALGYEGDYDDLWQTIATMR